MIDSMDIYKFLNINIGTVMKTREMLKFVPDHLKTKKVCKHAVIKLPYKAILENGGTLKSVPDCYKNQEICNKAVDNYPRALEFVPECYKIQKCVIKLSILILLQKDLFLNAL